MRQPAKRDGVPWTSREALAQNDLPQPPRQHDQILNDERQPLLSPRNVPIPAATSEVTSTSPSPRPAWSPSMLTLGYVGVVLLSCSVSLEAQTTSNLTVFAASAFNAHPLLTTVVVVRGTLMAVLKVPIAKVADSFGRLEAFLLAIVLCLVGYGQQAAANQFVTYAVAQMFAAAGFDGLQVLMQIFIADTSSMADRAFFSSLPRLPFLINAWLGPSLADVLMKNLGWRWGYGIWAFILPLAFLPLGAALTMASRSTAKQRAGSNPSTTNDDAAFWTRCKVIWLELDGTGLLLLAAALTLTLLPLTMVSALHKSILGLLPILIPGVVCLIALVCWERGAIYSSPRFFPAHFWTNRTLLASLGAYFFHFAALFLSVYSYFPSYLLVVKNASVPEAGRIAQTDAFTTAVVAIPFALIIKYTKRYKAWLILGIVIYVIGLCIFFKFCTEEASLVTITAAQVVLGTGSGLLCICAQLGLQAAAGPADVAVATALLLTFGDIGSTIGSTISGFIWTSSLLPRLQTYLPSDTVDQATAIYNNVSLAANGWEMGTPTRIAINRAYQETVTDILKVAIFIALPCLLLSFAMRSYRLDDSPDTSTGDRSGGDQRIYEENTTQRSDLPSTGPISQSEETTLET